MSIPFAFGLLSVLATGLILANDIQCAEPSEPQMYLMPDTRAVTTRVNQMYPSAQRDILSLDGPWEFELDEQDQGFTQNWQNGKTTFSLTTTVPAAVQAHDLGHKYDNWKYQTNYHGRVWYSKNVTIPADWAGRLIRLNLGGATPNFMLWLDGRLIGARYCDLTAFSYDLTPFVHPGQTHRLVISIDGRTWGSYRSDIGFMPWSGLWRSIELEAFAPVHLDDVFVRPDIDASTANFQIELTNSADQPRDLHLAAVATPWTDTDAPTAGKGSAPIHLEPNETKTLTIPVGITDMRLWSTEDPFLYRFDVTLTEGTTTIDSWSDRFGMRKWHVDAGRLLFNNRPFVVRGAMHQFDFPETISPTRQAWRARVREFKNLGFTYLRLTGSIATPELCDIADEEGLLLSSTVADTGVDQPHGVPDDHLRQTMPILMLRRWWEENVRQSRNHPSLFIYILTNERELVDYPHLPEIYHHVKNLDPTRLVANCDGPFPEEDTATIEIYDETDIWIPKIYPTAEQRQRKPFMIHEYVNAPTLPDISTLQQTHGPLFSPWLQTFADDIAKLNLTDEYPLFLSASYNLQREWVQLQFEALRMIPEADGYMACTQRDCEDITYAGFVGRFGKSKAVTPEDMRRWQGDTVLLCDLVSPVNRTYYAGDSVNANFTLSHYAEQVIQNGTLHWRLLDGDQSLAQGQLPNLNVAPYQLNSLGDIQFTSPSIASARQVTLQATLHSDTVTVTNHWKLWLFPTDQWLTASSLPVATTLDLPERLRDRYPFITLSAANAAPPSPSSLIITDTLANHLDFLAAGGRVLLLKPTEFPALPGAFIPGWWIPRYKHQGTILEDHPALARFPNEGFAGMQFNALMGGPADDHNLIDLHAQPDRAAQGYTHRADTLAFLYRDLPFPVQPLTRGLTWGGPKIVAVENHFRIEGPRPITYLFQLNVGQGKLLVVGYDITGPLPEQNWMFDSLLRYTLSPEFAPSTTVTCEDLKAFLANH
jgi:hypothetical protein